LHPAHARILLLRKEAPVPRQHVSSLSPVLMGSLLELVAGLLEYSSNRAVQ
jgi:hypothetical protein